MILSRIPVKTLVVLNQLDSDEIYAGYQSGRRGDDEPGHNRSFSFWHGWRNGLVDGGYAEKDDAQMLLAKAVVAECRADKP